MLVAVGVVAALAGAVNSIAGGGSLLLFPALLGAGLPPLTANVTNSVSVWPGFVGAVYGFREDLRTQSRRRLLALSVVTAMGAISGSVLLLVTPAAAFDVVVPALVLFASLLLAGQRWVGRLIAGVTKAEQPTDPSDGQPVASRQVVRRRVRIAIMMGTMLCAGVYGGYFGGALGVIMLVVLALTAADRLARLNALKAALSVVNATVTVVIFSLFGPVYWPAVAVAAPASLLGGYFGARIARRLNDEILRWCVVVVGTVVAVYLFLT